VCLGFGKEDIPGQLWGALHSLTAPPTTAEVWVESLIVMDPVTTLVTPQIGAQLGNLKEPMRVFQPLKVLTS
jgi:hypothetical protein